MLVPVLVLVLVLVLVVIITIVVIIVVIIEIEIGRGLETVHFQLNTQCLIPCMTVGWIKHNPCGKHERHRCNRVIEPFHINPT